MISPTKWIEKRPPYLSARNLNTQSLAIEELQNLYGGLSTGETIRGEWTPASGAEYPTPSTAGDAYYVGELSSPYFFEAGDLEGQTADNQDKMIFTDSGWILVEAITIPDTVKYVDSISDLSSVDTNIHTTVIVKSYYLDRTGGGGIFTYDNTLSSVNNGGTIIDGWCRLLFNEVISPLDFGARGNGYVDGSFNPDADDTIAILAARDWIKDESNLSSELNCPAGVFVLTETFEMFAGLTLRGAGVDMWDNLDPDVSLKSVENGTHFLFKGAGEKNKTLKYVLRDKVDGGVLSNPDSINARDTEYSLNGFSNADATGTTPATLKAFSTGIHIPPLAYGARIKSLRVVLNFEGIEGYKSETNTALGDDWDVGIFNESAPFTRIDDVQCVGYWNIAGGLISAVTDESSIPQVDPAGRAYHGHIYNSIFQGQTGLSIRGRSQFKCLDATTDTVTIPFDEEHYFEESGTALSNKGEFSYTSTEKVDDTFVFSGVSPDMLAAGLVDGNVRRGNSVGLGGMSINNSLITGLDHNTFLLATHEDIGLLPSTALEISGGIRQIIFSETYVQSKEDVLLHLHNVDDLKFSMCQIEANNFKVDTDTWADAHGGRIIASPQDINNTLVPTASGNTKMRFLDTHISPQVDIYPYVERTSLSKFSSTTSMYRPRSHVNYDLNFPDIGADRFAIKGLPSQWVDFITGEGFRFFNDTFDEVFTIKKDGKIVIGNGEQLSFEGGDAYINAPSGAIIKLRNGFSTVLEILPTAVKTYKDIIPYNTDASIAIGTATYPFKEVETADGVILKSPDDTRWRITVDDSGALSTTEL